MEDFENSINKFKLPIVVKADGLAAGKGVVICQNKKKAFEISNQIFKGKFKSSNKVVLLDVDVFGGINIKNKFKKNCLSIFIMPPSKNELLNRLKKRDSESQSQLLERELKMDLELNQSSRFDCIIKNVILEEACLEAEKIVRNFLK